MIILKKNGSQSNMRKIKLRKVKENLTIKDTMTGKNTCMNRQKGN